MEEPWKLPGQLPHSSLCPLALGSAEWECPPPFPCSAEDRAVCMAPELPQALLSPDVNECELYEQEGRPRLCMHTCVNTPGSYRCACPSGYRTLPDRKSCEGE